MSRITAERNQRALLDLVALPGNDVCADCKTRVPRWGSFNLGIFLCVNCASIHRKLGTHISKVKSLTLDAWTKEQVQRMKEAGNNKSNHMYNPNEARHPPPTNLVDGERDSELEVYIRSKYQFKRFLGKYGESNTKPSETTTVSSDGITGSASSSLASKNNGVSQNQSIVPSTSMPARTTSQTTEKPSLSSPPQNSATPSAVNGTTQSAGTGVWADLVSIQGPGQNSSLPLQIQMPAAPRQQLLQTGVEAYPTGIGVTTTSFQQQQPQSGMTAYTSATTALAAQQSMAFSTVQPPLTVPVVSPQPQFLHPQPQQPGAMNVFGTAGMNGMSAGYLSTPPPMGGPHVFTSSSPSIQQRIMPGPQPQQMMLSTTPQLPSMALQPTMPISSTTPQPLMPPPNTTIQSTGQYLVPGLQRPTITTPTGVSAGMVTNMGTGAIQGSAFVPMTQPQTQVANLTGQPYLQQPQMQMQFGGFQGGIHSMQPPFTAGAFATGGGHWGTM